MKYISVLVLIIIIFSFSNCKNYTTHPIEKGLVVEFSDDKSPFTKVKIAAYSPEIIEITGAPSDSLFKDTSLIKENSTNTNFDWKIEENKNDIQLLTSKLRVKLEIPSGIVKFFDSDSKLLLSEGISEMQPAEDSTTHYYHVKQSFNWNGREAHYGLGQHQKGLLNYRNHKVELYQANTKVSVPVLLSTKGYGLLWDNYSKTVYNDREDSSYIWSEVGDQLRYYFMYGPDFDNVIQNYRELTGEAAMYPKWAFGFFQSRNRYWTQDEILDVVETYRQKNIPLDVIVLDYFHWEDGFGSFAFDKQAFPNPGEMVATLHDDYNCKIMVSVWPSFTPETKNWRKMKENGYLLDVMSAYNSQVFDAYNPKARELYWNFIKNTYLERGVDALWFDVTEPEKIDQYKGSINFLGSSKRYLNTYSLFHTRGIYNHLVEYNEDERPYILTRSAFAGQQKYGTTVWSGDIGTNFKALKNQIPAGLNFCATGMPYWTTDIGGYHGGKTSDPDYRELYTRWFQYGTFCPIFRTHGRRHPGDRKTPNEVWSYGSHVQSIVTDYIRLRYRLLPYIYSISRKVNSEGYTIMRNLAFNFRNDTNVYNISDQFMFGDHMLINPVTEQGVRERSVYLPGDTNWYDFWTGKSYEGSQQIKAQAPLDKMPVFIQAGSIIPFGPFQQYATEKKSDPLEVRIYTGDNGSFTLYEDENNGFAYQSGAFSTIEFSYDETDKKLRIGKRKGEFPGMLTERTFHIIRVRPNHGVGIKKAISADTTVHYDGKEKVISLD